MANNTEKRITAKMVLDSTGYNDKLKGLNSEMKKHQAELKLASEGIKSFGKDSEKLKSVQESLTKQLELHSKKVDIYKQSIEKTNSKMQDNIKTRDKIKESLDKANKKYEEAVKIYGKESDEAKKAKEEVDGLSKEHEKASKSVETNAKQIQNYETNLDKAKTQMVKTQGELQKVNSELDKSNNKWIKASEGLKKSSEKLKDIGGKVSSAGDKILKLSAPLAAGGLASLKFATDFEDSIAKVSTIADTTQVPINDLRKGILKLSDDTNIASSEIANNVYDAISAGQETGDAVNFVRSSTKLAKAGFAEAGQSLDVLTTIMNAYKMKAEDVTKVSDYLITTQNEGKVTVAELSSSMGKIIPTAVATNTQLNQVAAGYALTTKNGIKAAEATTYMNSMLNEMSKTGSTADKTIRKVSGKSFSDLMKSGKNVSDVLNMMNDYAKKNNLSLKDLFGSAEAGKAALVLSTNAGKDFNEMLEAMDKSAGATDKAFKKVTNTTGERFKKSLNQLRNDAIKLGDSVAPLMDKLSSGISKIADKLNGLSKEQLDSMVKWGTFAIASGGALKVVGGGISTIGNIAGGLSKLTGVLGKASIATKGVEGATKGIGLATGVAGKGMGAMGLATKASTLLLNPWALGIGAVAIAGVGLAKHLKKDCIPTMDLFADKTTYTTKQVEGVGQVTEKNTVKISKETKKQLGAYMDLDDKATKAMMSLKFNSTKITKENAKGITDTYTKMTKQTVQAIVDKNKKETDEMKKFFAENSMLSDEEEKKILEKKQKQCDFEKNIVEQGNARIKEIMDKASKEKRELTAEEQRVINNIQDNMKQSAVKHMSQSEVEQKVIMERLKTNAGNITAKQAGDVIKNSAKARDKTIKDANEKYDKTVAWAIRERDENKTISAEEADKIIAAAEREKNGVTQKAKDMHSNVVREAKGQCKEHIKQIDTETGEVKKNWQRLKDWFKNNPVTRFFKSVGKNDVDSVGRNWTGTNYWQGGLTYLHDTPGKNNNYELYDLPRGTRIFNHDASADLVEKTAENVATKVANSVLSGFGGNSGGTIIVPVQLDGREIARVTTPYISNNLTKNTKGRR